MALTTLTYNNLIQLFTNIATAHKQLKSFGNGELWEINGDPKNSGVYPEAWLVPVNTIVRTQTIEYTVRLLVYDLVNKDESNENEVLSDTLQILSDITKVFRYESDNFNLLNDPTFEPFTERFDDEVTGWSAEFVIEVNFPSNDCDMPLNEFVMPGVVSGGFTIVDFGQSGYSGYSGFSGINGVVGGSGVSGFSGYSGLSGTILHCVNQIGHGFSLGDVIRVSGEDTYSLALADSSTDAESIGIVSEISDADNFCFTQYGVITVGVPNLPAGTVLFLSDVTPGLLTQTEPVTVGNISKPMAIILEDSVKMEVICMRGAVITAGAASGYSGVSGFSGVGVSGYSGTSGVGVSGYSGTSGLGISGYSGYSGTSGFSGTSGVFNLTVSNGLTATATTLKLGGPLTGATNITGNQSLSLGTSASRLNNLFGYSTTLSVLYGGDSSTPSEYGTIFTYGSANNYLAGVQSTDAVDITSLEVTPSTFQLLLTGLNPIINIDNAGITVANNGVNNAFVVEDAFSKGVVYATDYSANFTPESLVSKRYVTTAIAAIPSVSGYSGYSGTSGFSGYSGTSGFSGYSGISGYSGVSGFSGNNLILPSQTGNANKVLKTDGTNPSWIFAGYDNVDKEIELSIINTFKMMYNY